MAIVSVQNLNKTYRGAGRETVAAKNISLDIQPGTSIAITGPSGCGKTTLINLLGLVIRPDSGKIIIDSQDAAGLKAGKAAGLRNRFFGYVVQNYALLNGYTAAENIAIPLIYARPKISEKERRRRIEEMAEQAGIAHKLRDKVELLSGGEQQRVAIARALVNSPEIILADEPTGSLDSVIGEEIFTLLMGFVNRGKTLIMVTHNQELAARCGTIIHMVDGEVV